MSLGASMTPWSRLDPPLAVDAEMSLT